jgi:hypothetical protein
MLGNVAGKRVWSEGDHAVSAGLEPPKKKQKNNPDFNDLSELPSLQLDFPEAKVTSEPEEPINWKTLIKFAEGVAMDIGAGDDNQDNQKVTVETNEDMTPAQARVLEKQQGLNFDDKSLSDSSEDTITIVVTHDGETKRRLVNVYKPRTQITDQAGNVCTFESIVYGVTKGRSADPRRKSNPDTEGKYYAIYAYLYRAEKGANLGGTRHTGRYVCMTCKPDEARIASELKGIVYHVVGGGNNAGHGACGQYWVKDERVPTVVLSHSEDFRTANVSSSSNILDKRLIEEVLITKSENRITIEIKFAEETVNLKKIHRAEPTIQDESGNVFELCGIVYGEAKIKTGYYATFSYKYSILNKENRIKSNKRETPGTLYVCMCCPPDAKKLKPQPFFRDVARHTKSAASRGAEIFFEKADKNTSPAIVIKKEEYPQIVVSENNTPSDCVSESPAPATTKLSTNPNAIFANSSTASAASHLVEQVEQDFGAEPGSLAPAAMKQK